MSNAPIKTLLLKGNLKNNFISAKLYPVTEFTQGRWNFCVSQMIYYLKEDLVKDKICGISTNLIKGQVFNTSNEIETVFQTLNIFLIQGKKNQKKLINFDKTWSLINNFSEDLNIYVSSIGNDDDISQINCEVFILINLQRIQ